MNEVEIDTNELVQTIVHAIYEKSGKEVVDVDLSSIENVVFSHFVICHGSSNAQVEAICEGVLEKVRTTHQSKPFHVEGMQNAQWVLMDYGDVVVHIFQNEYRNFYNLEALWADADIRQVEDRVNTEKE